MSTAANILPVDFTKPARTYRSLGGGVYADPRTGHYYCRPRVAGRRTWRKLASTTVTKARQEAAKKLTDHQLARDGLAHDPFTRARSVTVGALLDDYLAAGCPDRRDQPITGAALSRRTVLLTTLRAFWAAHPAREVRLDDCREYHVWRKALARRGVGDRQTDKELVVLSGVFRWAVRHSRKTGLTVNPIGQDRPQFRDPAQVRHARDCQPKDGDELNQLANFLFASRRSEVLAWQALFQAMLGSRANEILRLRMDAQDEQAAGYVDRAKNCLFLHRTRSSKGTYPFAELHPDLAELLRAHAHWHQQRHPRSPWFFPSPEDATKPVRPESLTHRLKHACVTLGLPHRTSHGLRSYFVNVLRSQKIPDHEVALRVGQRTAGQLIVSVYGEKFPYVLAWRPAKGEPAWARWLTGSRHTSPHTSPPRNGYKPPGKPLLREQRKPKQTRPL